MKDLGTLNNPVPTSTIINKHQQGQDVNNDLDGLLMSEISI
jgi:hypothetical protein